MGGNRPDMRGNRFDNRDGYRNAGPPKKQDECYHCGESGHW